MKLTRLAAVLLSLGLSVLSARADVAADYTALTAGLMTVTGSGGTPGTVVLHGRTAFPVFTQNTNGTAPVVAAGHWNDDTNAGRGLAYAHTGWTGTTGDMGLAMSNALRWAARAKPGAVVAKGANVSTTFLTTLGYTVKTVDTTMATSGTDLTGVDVFLMNGQSDYAAGALTKITNFLAAGGGVLVFSTPWAASGAALADANTVLCGVGLTFSGDYNSGGPFNVAAAAYPPYVSAFNGLDLLLAHRAGTTNLPLAVQQAAADGIDGVLAVRPLFPPLTNGLQQLLDTYGGFIRIHAGRTLTRAAAPIEALCERYQSGVLDLTPAAELTAHPDADDFPGPVSASAPIVNRTVLVHGNAPPDDPALINQGSHGTRQPVGLYARAGSVLRVTIPPDKTAAGLRIQIGHHHDVNFHLDDWHRHPKVVRLEPLTNVVNEIGSPFGGLVLVRVPPGAVLGDFPITIEGAVEAPHFEQGVSAPGDWNRLRTLPGAQGYIRASNFTAYVSRPALQGVVDPARVAGFWGGILSNADFYMGYLRRFREEAGKVDRDIVAGFGHAGYPVVMAYGRDDDELVQGVLEDGDWGFYHELGHTYQDNGHGWNGTAGGEVDVNLIPNLLMTLVHRRSLWDNNTHSTMDAANRAAARATLFSVPLASRSWFDINGGDVAGYDFFFNLPESFGYDLWRRAFSRFYRWSTNNASEPSFAGLDRYHRWFVAMCEETGYNLAPYFDNYGWTNLDAAVKARFAGLPAWSSNRPPATLHLPGPLTLAESTPPGTLVATFTTTDPDPGNLFVYSILSGNEDGAFTLDRWSGELRVASLDYERRSNYTLTVTVFDNALPRYFLTNTLSVSVLNAGEPPQVSVPLLRTVSLSAAGTVLGTVSAIPDTGRTIASYARVGGDPLFAINAASGTVTLTQTAPSLNGGVLWFTVRVTDNTGAFRDAQVPVLLNTLPGLREQRWNGAAAAGPAAYDGLTNAWPSANFGDNYVRRLTAWLVPPRTGAYTFWVTGSDRATFLLGTNASPVSASSLCTGASTGVGNFDADPGQRSAPVWLEAGQAYYLEVLQTEGTGSDYAQAAWQGPGILVRELIPSSVLIPGSDVFFPPGAGAGAVTGVRVRIGAGDPGGVVTLLPPVGVEVAAEFDGDLTAVTNVDFQLDGVLYVRDAAPPYYAFWNTATAGWHTWQAVARDRHGNTGSAPARLVQVVQGAVTNSVVASNAVWRYFDKGLDLGTAWSAVAYDDSGWSNGAARLGFGGQGEATVINGGLSTARYPTTYFRRAVLATNLARFIGFNLGVARDDGAVVHLNGREVFRTGLNAGAVSYSTLAVNATDVQTFFATNLPPSLFVEGTNILAVEVHQTSATSSDLGFALKLDGVLVTPALSVAVTEPAPGASLPQPGVLPVAVQASTPSGVITNVAVRVDGVPLGDVPAATGTVAWGLPSLGAHVLSAVARNSLGQSVTSAPVSVTITPNLPPTATLLTPGRTVTNPPLLVLEASAADADDAVQSVELFDGATSLGTLHGGLLNWLVPSPALGLHTYRAVATDLHGLRGTSAPVFLLVVAAPQAVQLSCIATGSQWRYHDGGVDLGLSWTNVAYAETGWSNGMARLGFGGDGETTVLRGQPRITYYFRKSFLVPAGFAGTNITVRLSRDDGAVVYLNGMELARDNMPSGAVGYSTRPLAAVSAPNEQAFFTFATNATALRPGTNVLAVEVHQIDGTSSDLGFDLELSAGGWLSIVDSPAPILTLTPVAPGLVRLAFSDANGLLYAVEGSTNLVSWFPLATNGVSGGVFQHVLPSTQPPAQFLRVRRLP